MKLEFLDTQGFISLPTMLVAFVGSVLTSILISSNLFAAAAPGNVVDVGYAKYRGNQSYPNTVAYLGIPYAEPPLGDLRFRAPLPLNTSRVSSKKVIDATQYPDFCVQGKISTNDHGGAGSEDCLKVNIYAPTGAKEGSNLPVLVYIHGGGYIYGNPRNWPFDHWVHQSPNVVIVSVYYRLDAFGFIATPWFQIDPTLGDLNAGFQDQIQALKWVQQYISKFGGNPKKVTINGESAGGSSVELHLTATETTGLFSQAIAQSVYRTPVPPVKQQGPLFDYFAEKVGCGDFTTNTTDRMACLRSAPVGALALAQDSASTPDFNGSAYNVFHPVVDGKFITDYPSRALGDGKFTAVPLIVGSTTNETLANGADIASALQSYFPSFQADERSALEALYPETDFASSSLRQQTLTGDASVRCGRTIMAQAFSNKTKAWTYRYNQAVPSQTGVQHAAENWMLFLGTSTGINGTTTFQPMTPIETAFASEVIAYWLSFVRSGNPNTYRLSKSPKWPQYTPDNKARIVLQQDPKDRIGVSGSFVETEPDIETQRCLQNQVEAAISQQN